jgi:hypothetical protein
MAIGLDAIGIGVEHQEADLAAGSGGACPENHLGKGVEHPTEARCGTGGKDRAAARPDPCRL